MFVCYRMFERFMNYTLLTVTGKNSFQFSFPDITRFNAGVKATSYMASLVSGLPFESFYSASMGIEPKDLESLTYYSEALGLREKFIPLMSSNTMNSNDVMNTGGRPTKPTAELSDVQINQKNKGTAEKRTQ